jgi:hypothetical protein
LREIFTVQEMAIGAGRAPYMEEGILVERASIMVHVYFSAIFRAATAVDRYNQGSV